MGIALGLGLGLGAGRVDDLERDDEDRGVLVLERDGSPLLLGRQPRGILGIVAALAVGRRLECNCLGLRLRLRADAEG